MKVLVTGGAGFIGSHLCERLEGQGHSAVIVDDLNTFYDPALKRQNLAAVCKPDRVVFHQADVCDAEAIDRIFQVSRPDALIHLAARAGTRQSVAEPFLYQDVNVRGTLTMLEACKRHGIGKVIFASSSSVYGIVDGEPVDETSTVDCPVSPYAATKVAGERLCYTYSHLHGISVVCLRLFTVYGPRQRPDLVIRKFMESIDCGRPIRIFGNGMSKRDYTYVDDVVDAIVRSLAYECRFDVFNVGNGSPVALNDLIRLLEDELGRRADIEQCPEQPGDVPATYADISKARRVLGYDPVTRFQDGINRTVAWHRSQHIGAGVKTGR